MIDHYWGPAGPYNTFFRNRAELYGIVMTNSNGYDSNLQNFVGNDCPNTGFFMGNYVITGTNHVQHGNNIRGTVNPSGTSTVADVSYYLTEAPTFWTNAGNWPTIGYPNAGGSGTIPAKERYIAGGDITVCVDEIVTDVDENFSTENSIIVFPNPFSNEFSVKFISEKTETISLSIIDVTGKIVFMKNAAIAKGENRISVLENTFLSSGIYFLRIQTQEEIRSLKIISR